MIDVRFRFFDDPAPKRARRDLIFRTTFAGTLDKLEDELRLLRAKDIVVEAGFQSADIRNDGWPRGGSRPKHPAICLHFIAKDGNTLAMPAHAYRTYHQ